MRDASSTVLERYVLATPDKAHLLRLSSPTRKGFPSDARQPRSSLQVLLRLHGHLPISIPVLILPISQHHPQSHRPTLLPLPLPTPERDVAPQRRPLQAQHAPLNLDLAPPRPHLLGLKPLLPLPLVAAAVPQIPKYNLVLHRARHVCQQDVGRRAASRGAG